MLRSVASSLSTASRFGALRVGAAGRDFPLKSLSTSVETVRPKHAPVRPIRSKGRFKTKIGNVKPRLPSKARASRSSPQKPALRPYDLAQRLKKLCDEGELDEAISQLKSMPLDAQNVSVWNTVLREITQAERFKLAFETYIDMKRRGFTPNLRTYTTLFGGFASSSVRDWEKRLKQLEQVTTLHENYLEYAARIREQNPYSPELSNAPTRAYLRILGYATDFQRMFDVFNDMDEEGPIAPDQLVYRAMLLGIATRKLPTDISNEARAALRLENASQAKQLWRRLVKHVEKTDEPVDPPCIRAILFALSQGSPSDHLLAFDIVRDYIGLTKPGETSNCPVNIEKDIFAQVLHLCHGSQKYRLAYHFFQQVLGRPRRRGEGRVITEEHVEIVLRAFASLSMTNSGESGQALEVLTWLLKEWAAGGRPHKLMPDMTHFDLVASCCYRSGDWSVATQTYELLTGYTASDFSDDGVAAKGGRPQRTIPSGRPSDPDITFLSHLVRTALNSGDFANMHQCLRIVDNSPVQLDQLGSMASRFTQEESMSMNSRASVRGNVVFYSMRLSKDIIATVDKVVPKERSSPLREEQRQWLSMRSRCLRTLQVAPRLATTPFLAEDPLGGQRTLARMDSFVEYDMTVRRPSSRSKR